MQILLINDNSSVSKLINLTAKKYDYDIEEVDDISKVEHKKRDIVFVDDGVLKEVDSALLKERTECEELVYIGSKGVQKPDEYKHMLIKPFLPSDFKKIVESIAQEDKATEQEVKEQEVVQEEVDSDLSKEKEDAISDELQIDSLNDDEDVSNIQKSDDDLEDEIDDVTLQEKVDEEDLDIESLKDEQGDDEELLLDNKLFIDNEESIKTDDEDSDNLIEELVGHEDDKTAILDKEDIQEVKELLQESDDEDISDELQVDEDIKDESDLKVDETDSTQDSFDIDDLKDQLEDEDDIVFQEDKDDKDIYLSEAESIKEEDIAITDEFKDKDKEKDEDKEEVLSNENDIKVKEDEKEELDLIDEDSLRELFDQQDDSTSKVDIKDQEEDRYKKISKKSKSKKKKKRAKKKKLALQEEIVSKLLDIDTLREVLDGMEIRIKFYNKNKR